MPLVIEMESMRNQSSFSPFVVQNDVNASGGQFIVWPHGGSHQNLGTPSDGATGQVLITFILSQTANVQFQMRINFPTVDDDSFYYKMDSGSWITMNNLDTVGWETLDVTTFSTLSSGTHTLRILRRENGAMFDYVTLTESVGVIKLARFVDNVGLIGANF